MISNGPPPYSPYASQAQYKQLGPQDSRNACWRGWGIPGVLLGSLLFLIGISMIPIEIARIFRGSLNRGDRNSYFLYPNYNVDANADNAQIQAFLPDIFSGTANSRYRLDQKGIVPFSGLSASGVNNFPIQDKYLWPWSHAALLFACVTIAAGGIGILSGCRRTYSSVFAFFTLALLSGLLSIFLVAYYATHVHWHLSHNSNRKRSFWPSSIDFSLGCAMLALSCASCLFSFLSAIFTGLSLALCCGSKGNSRPITSKEAKANKGKGGVQYVPIKQPPRYLPLPGQQAAAPPTIVPLQAAQPTLIPLRPTLVPLQPTFIPRA